MAECASRGLKNRVYDTRGRLTGAWVRRTRLERHNARHAPVADPHDVERHTGVLHPHLRALCVLEREPHAGALRHAVAPAEPLALRLGAGCLLGGDRHPVDGHAQLVDAR
nr:MULTISPECIES: hypothetical protein [Corynebacterium]